METMSYMRLTTIGNPCSILTLSLVQLFNRELTCQPGVPASAATTQQPSYPALTQERLGYIKHTPRVKSLSSSSSSSAASDFWSCSSDGSSVFQASDGGHTNPGFADRTSIGLSSLPAKKRPVNNVTAEPMDQVDVEPPLKKGRPPLVQSDSKPSSTGSKPTIFSSSSMEEDGVFPKDKETTRNSKSVDKKPKRPLSAYNIFFKHERQQLLMRDANQDAQDSRPQPSFEEIGKILGRKWKQETSQEERDRYERMAERDRKRYSREMAQWKLEKRRSRQERQLAYMQRTTSSHETPLAQSATNADGNVKNTENLKSFVTPHIQAVPTTRMPQQVIASSTFPAVSDKSASPPTVMVTLHDSVPPSSIRQGAVPMQVEPQTEELRQMPASYTQYAQPERALHYYHPRTREPLGAPQEHQSLVSPQLTAATSLASSLPSRFYQGNYHTPVVRIVTREPAPASGPAAGLTGPAVITHTTPATTRHGWAQPEELVVPLQLLGTNSNTNAFAGSLHQNHVSAGGAISLASPQLAAHHATHTRHHRLGGGFVTAASDAASACWPLTASPAFRTTTGDNHRPLNVRGVGPEDVRANMARTSKRGTVGETTYHKPQDQSQTPKYQVHYKCVRMKESQVENFLMTQQDAMSFDGTSGGK